MASMFPQQGNTNPQVRLDESRVQDHQEKSENKSSPPQKKDK